MKPRILLVAGLLAAPSSFVQAEVVNRIVASIDGEPITLYELREYTASQKALLPSLPSATEKDLLQALITERLLVKEIAAKNIRVRDEDIQRYIGHIRDQNKLTDDQLEEALKNQGLDYDRYKQQVRREIEKVQLLNREIRGKVNVTPEDVHRYYVAHQEEHKKPASVHLRQILIRLAPEAPAEIAKAVEERAAEIRKRIVGGGEDFATVAKQTSEDATAPEGGDLGEVEPSKVLPEFEGPIEKMKEGEVSEPIRTASGVHLLKLEKRIDEGYTPEEELAAGIKDKLYNEALDERYKRWLLEDIQKNHYIEIKL